jgi:hypothetical protein
MKRKLPGLLCIACFLLAGWGAISLCGFSTTRLSFVSDQVLINAAIHDVLDRYPPNLRTVKALGDGQSVETYAPPEYPVRYESLKQFVEINPNCCVFVARGSEGYEPSSLSYLLGYEWRIVRVRYLLRQRTGLNSLQGTAMETYVVLSRNGRVFRPH